MNFQLIEDLTKLNQNSMNIINLAFKSFHLLTSQFLAFINANYKQNIKVFIQIYFPIITSSLSV